VTISFGQQKGAPTRPCAIDCLLITVSQREGWLQTHAFEHARYGIDPRCHSRWEVLRINDAAARFSVTKRDELAALLPDRPDPSDDAAKELVLIRRVLAGRHKPAYRTSKRFHGQRSTQALLVRPLWPGCQPEVPTCSLDISRDVRSTVESGPGIAGRWPSPFWSKLPDVAVRGQD